MIIEGVDYSYDPPSATGLAAAGKKFVVRYGAVGNTGKYLTAAEVEALNAAGLDIVANVEETAKAFRGTATGVRHAKAGEAFFRNLGMPDHRPIYFSVDWDAGSSDWAAIDAALRGSAAVLGADRVGVYGGYDTIAHCASAGTASWFWQTYAWSGGRWHSACHLQQYKNNVALAGGTVDLTRAMVADYGQWGGTVVQSPEYSDLPWSPPNAYGTGRDGKAVRYIVIHYTAGAERNTSAEDGAAYDQRRTDGVSTHYFADSNSVVQCVLTKDRANAARAKGNRLGIQYELCGTVQTRAQWLDAASLPTLRNAARQVARDCRKYGIPVRRLSIAETRAAWYDFPDGPKGIVGHVDCTNAYPEDGGDHTDPGTAFPWDVFLDLVRAELEGDDMAMTETDVKTFATAKIWPAPTGITGPMSLQDILVRLYNRTNETKGLAGDTKTLTGGVSGALSAYIAAEATDDAAKNQALAALQQAVDAMPVRVLDMLGDPAVPSEKIAAALSDLLGDRAAEVGRLLAATGTA